MGWGCCSTNAWTLPADTPALVQQHESRGTYLKLKDGTSIFVRDEGRLAEQEHQATVVMIHGVPASSYLYRKFFPRLKELGHRAIAMDLPGMGLSDKPREYDYSWPALAESLHEILEHPDLKLHASSKIHLVIHDIGGPIGALYAAAHPERVAHLTVLDTLLDIASFRPPFPMFFFPIPLIGSIAVQSFTPWVFRRFMYLRGVLEPEACNHEEAVAWVWLLKHNNGGASFSKIMKSFPKGKKHRAQLTERIKSKLQDLPLQVVWAQGEVAIPQSQCTYIRENFPNVQEVHQVPGRHFYQLESADTIVQKIHLFLKDNNNSNEAVSKKKRLGRGEAKGREARV